MFIEGFVKIGTRTKELVKYLTPEDIAVIQHDDIDELAAEALIDTKLRAIINTGCSMTGKYYSRGTALLVHHNIMLYDTCLDISHFKDNDMIRVKGRDLVLNNSRLFNNSCVLVNKEYIQQKVLQSSYSYTDQLASFIDNTLEYASNEKEHILGFENYPDLSTNINGRCAIAVVRSSESREALEELRSFIENERPVLIGVDGGADTIIATGFTPDILIGDMDSVSDVGIYRSKEVILHAYLDHSCPCLERVSALSIRYKLLPMPGTSEDVALLLAYGKGAEKIILVGGHSSMTDFMERGRKGMGSTLITRMIIGDRLIDYKDIKKLQQIVSDSRFIFTPKAEGDLLWMKV